jgi:hypothetical protein
LHCEGDYVGALVGFKRVADQSLDAELWRRLVVLLDQVDLQEAS